jgi:uncharacterized protein (TIGR03083 family)
MTLDDQLDSPTERSAPSTTAPAGRPGLPEAPTSVGKLLAILRNSHHQLVALAARLHPSDLSRPSYAREWTVAQVYSHLGSGAEIGSAAVRTALDRGVTPPDPEPIWARWNAKTPEAMAYDYVDADDRYLTTVEALDAATRERLRVPFHLNPVDLATYLTLRLTEHALHNWDIRVAYDPEATLAAAAVPSLIDVLVASAAEVSERTTAARLAPAQLLITTVEPHGRYLLTINDSVSLRPIDDQAAAIRPGVGRLELPTEALMRLVAGRLDPQHTPARTVTHGTPTLDDLRELFPGY